MKSLSNTGAPSARRRATDGTSQFFRAGALGMMLTLIVLLLSSCDRNSKGQTAEAKENPSDSVMTPKVDIRVNRRFDDKGNMIGFDSTYTSYYTNMSGDTARMDSLMESFDHYFRTDHSSFFRKQFDPLFFNDTTRYPDFFHNDYFMKRYELNDHYLRGMMQQMDSIKNKFYREHRTVDKKSST